MVGKKGYQAPEMQKVEISIYEEVKINWEKIAVYALGIIILMISTFRTINSLYDLDEEELFEIIREEVNVPTLKIILPKMLRSDPELRASLNDLVIVTKKGYNY